MQATSESRSPSFIGKECCHSNKEFISRNMIARDLHEQSTTSVCGRREGRQVCYVFGSERNPLGETHHWVMRVLLQ
jgi:hypothetical protein